MCIRDSGKGVRPSVAASATTATTTRAAITATTLVRSPWMTAAYRLQVRQCPTTATVSNTVACTGTWVLAPAATTIGADVKVTQTVAGLAAGRVYEVRFVTWQAALAAPAAASDPAAAGAAWTTSMSIRMKTLP